mmetsp:Transcript_33743/g.73736  ORF Transcript_33743/g.73736 Transcript_33743/m.73736 type:complete len:227 (+) Transcript_33743:2078-2758(+)
MRARPCERCPRWITPSPAVALNLAQLVARESQSRFSLRNMSTVVPACMSAFARMVAEWHTELRVSTASLIPLRMSRSALLWLERNCRWSPMGASPHRIDFSFVQRSWYTGAKRGFDESTTAASGTASGAGAMVSISVSMASVAGSVAPSAAGAAVSAAAGGGGGVALLAIESRVFSRNCWISFSHKSKPIWYASRVSSSLPEMSLSRMSATASWSSKNIRHVHTLM